jgi:putative mRNA 3-end processing factor
MSLPPYMLSMAQSSTTTPGPAWINVRPEGLYCGPGNFFIDPHSPVEQAVITHAHGDHARAGHGAVLATAETLAVMRVRYGTDAAREQQPAVYGQPITHKGVEITLFPAGHILGSAQVRLSWNGSTVVFSGDFKRRYDPTTPPFEPVTCDVFVTEATFGLPVFVHPPAEEEIGRLLRSLRQFPERCHLVGVYVLGKCQRVIRVLREAGYDRPIYLHGALIKLCQLYEEHGLPLGALIPFAETKPASLAGEIVLAPPSALHDRWASKLPEPVTALASGWMRIRARAKQKAVELPLVISDHADWPELTRTLEDVGAPEIWVTHGREDALVQYASKMGYRASALSLLGYDEEEE